VSVESLDAVQTRGGPDNTLPFSHCLRWKHDFSSEMADDGKDGIAAPGFFPFSSQDQCARGQELMILVWVWVGNALLHSARYFEASVGIAFSQTFFCHS
jgi:hypothetical protein